MNTNLEIKELSLCHKLKYLIFYIIADNRIHGLKYLRTTTSQRYVNIVDMKIRVCGSIPLKQEQTKLVLENHKVFLWI